MIEEKLEELGFIIKRKLKPGMNRVSTEYKPHKQNGVVWINQDTVVYYSYDDSVESGFFYKRESVYEGMSTEEKIAARNKYIEESQAIHEQVKLDGLLQMRKVFGKFQRQCIEHSYLTKKQVISDHKLKIDFYGNIIVPAYSISKELMGYQIISETDKNWKTGSTPNGAFFPFTNGGLLFDAKVILLAEGYATSASINMSIGNKYIQTISCFSSTNIDKVAYILQNNPNIIGTVIAIKDNDYAGRKVKTLGFTIGDDNEDANDFMIKNGIDKLKDTINEQIGFILKGIK